jgi:hypothetical protein
VYAEHYTGPAKAGHYVYTNNDETDVSS